MVPRRLPNYIVYIKPFEILKVTPQSIGIIIFKNKSGLEFPLWPNGISHVLRALEHGFDTWPSTAG